MANDIALFREAGATIPAHLRTGALDSLTKSLMGSSGSNKTISIRGGSFRMVVDGQEVMVSEDRALDVVIVNAAPHISRTYYEGAYKEGEKSAPVCWSNDGTKPDPSSESPQASACAVCPMNINGSGQGTSRACRFNRRLAVVVGSPHENSDIYRMVIPAQSIFGKAENGKMPLGAYAKFIGGHGLTISSVLTEIRFDASSTAPKLTFRAARALTVEEIEAAGVLGRDQQALDAVIYNPVVADSNKTPTAGYIPAPAAPVFRETKVQVAPEVEPVVREKKAAPAPAKDLADVLSQWGDDED
jgi:hypothetical protein